VEKPEGVFHLKDIGVDGRIILKCLLEKEDGRGGCRLHFLSHDRDKYRAVVNTVMNLWVLSNDGEILDWPAK